MQLRFTVSGVSLLFFPPFLSVLGLFGWFVFGGGVYFGGFCVCLLVCLFHIIIIVITS